MQEPSSDPVNQSLTDHLPASLIALAFDLARELGPVSLAQARAMSQIALGLYSVPLDHPAHRPGQPRPC